MRVGYADERCPPRNRAQAPLLLGRTGTPGREGHPLYNRFTLIGSLSRGAEPSKENERHTGVGSIEMPCNATKRQTKKVRIRGFVRKINKYARGKKIIP